MRKQRATSHLWMQFQAGHPPSQARRRCCASARPTRCDGISVEALCRRCRCRRKSHKLNTLKQPATTSRPTYNVVTERTCLLARRSLGARYTTVATGGPWLAVQRIAFVARLLCTYIWRRHATCVRAHVMKTSDSASTIDHHTKIDGKRAGARGAAVQERATLL